MQEAILWRKKLTETLSSQSLQDDTWYWEKQQLKNTRMNGEYCKDKFASFHFFHMISQGTGEMTNTHINKVVKSWCQAPSQHYLFNLGTFHSVEVVFHNIHFHYVICPVSHKIVAYKGRSRIPNRLHVHSQNQIYNRFSMHYIICLSHVPSVCLYY